MPSHKNYRKICEELLLPLDIRIYEDKDNKRDMRPWDMQVHNPELYKRVLSYGSKCSLPLGDSYMEGWWDASALDKFFEKLTKNRPRIPSHLPIFLSVPFIQRKAAEFFHTLYERIVNPQNRILSKQVAEQHYDLGNDFYEIMLDSPLTADGNTDTSNESYMQYTCGYWRDARNLHEAQRNKLDLICIILHLPRKGSQSGRLERIC